jgi:hypothetical protein
MPPLRRRYLILTLLALLLAGGLVLGAALVPPLYAEGTLPAVTLPFFDIFSVSGIVALFGVGVHWGDTRAKLKGLVTARDEMREEMREGFSRIDRQVETLFELMGAERRTQRRRDVGVRAEERDPPA